MDRQDPTWKSLIVHATRRVVAGLGSKVVRRKDPFVWTRGSRSRADRGVRMGKLKQQVELSIATAQLLQCTPRELLNASRGAGGRGATRGS